MSEAEKNRHTLFDMPGMQEYKGVLYMHFTTPSLLKDIEKMKMNKGDILFATYVRSGTLMLSEFMWLVMNNADIAAARKTRVGVRARFLEHAFDGYDPVADYASMKSPRLIKTHLPSSFFKLAIENGQLKAVIMVRDPRDMLVSLYRMYTDGHGYVKYKGSWNDFFNLFKAKQLFGGDWFDNTLSWLKYKDRENVLLLRYEEVRRNPVHYVSHLARFCDKELTVKQVRDVADYCINDVREWAKQGEWRNYFTPDQERYFQGLYDEKMTNTDFKCLCES